MEQPPQSQRNEDEERGPPIVLHARPYREGGKTVWGLDFNPDPPRHAKAEIDLRDEPPGQRIIFHLVKSPGIRFNTLGPIWVVENGPCPPPQDSSHSQIRVEHCNDHMLQIFNSNNKRCDLVYQLNFIGVDEQLDPMIRNGGT